MLDVLGRWNRWGTARLDSGVPRELAGQLEPFLRGKEVVVLTGPRRAGKTTVMYQLMDRLEAQGMPKSAMLHVNLEEPGLAGSLGVQLLEDAYMTFRHHVRPTGRAWLFLDEIQRVEGWERWVRARTESDDLKVFLTGSSSALMSRELGTLLTGRHVTFQVFPLSFREFLGFRKVALPERPKLAEAAPAIRHALLEYLKWGGFPEVVLSDSEERRDRLLKQYFDDVLFKDVSLRHGVRDMLLLRALAVTLLNETASLTSQVRLAARLGASLDLVRAYCSYLQEAYLVAFLPYYSLKVAERQRRPQKVHAIDTGVRNAVVLSGSPDWGRLAETSVWSGLARDERLGLYHWKGGGEVDLLSIASGRVTNLIQVVWDGAVGNSLSRETEALEEGRIRFPEAGATLVYSQGTRPAVPEHVRAVPLWRALLDPAGL